MNHSLYRCAGFDFVSSPALCKSEPKTVNRSWKERIFSWPWRPLKSTKIITVMAPSDEVIIDPNKRVVYAHPAIMGDIKKQLESIGVEESLF